MPKGRASLIYITVLVLLVSASFGGGFVVGKGQIPEVDKVVGISNKETGNPAELDFSPFWKAWNTLDEEFVPTNASNTEPVSDQDKLWAAISGLARVYGDPYTVFFPPAENALFESDINGNFEGVGMEIGIREGILTVIAPLKGTPAERSGIRTGDMILKIEDKSTAEMSVEKAVELIRGTKGTEVKLTILSEGEETARDVKVTRDVIDLPVLETEMKTTTAGDKIFVIKLFSFSAPSISKFKNALLEFSKSNTDKLVLDLRGNPGGYLEAAVDIASWFLPDGEVVVREYFGEGKEEHVYRSKGYNVFTDQLKLVILIDGGSASASEILAGALSEHKKGTLVGTDTFGKGSVQELVDVTDNTALKVTIARWLTPEGVSISETGLKPDVVVEFTAEDAKNDRDPQMGKAIEILTK